MDDIKVERDGEDPQSARNRRLGCLAVVVFAVSIPVIIVAIPLVAGLYRWAFGG